MVTATVAQPASAAPVRTPIGALIRGAIAHHGIRAAIVQVTVAGRPMITKAYGSSMAGVSATTRTHFRNGAVAISYMSTLLLRLVDAGKVRLDDPISRWLPHLPDARQVTLGMLAGMTAGYHDYVLDPHLVKATYTDPFALRPAEVSASSGSTVSLRSATPARRGRIAFATSFRVERCGVMVPPSSSEETTGSGVAPETAGSVGVADGVRRGRFGRGRRRAVVTPVAPAGNRPRVRGPSSAAFAVSSTVISAECPVPLPTMGACETELRSG